MNPRSFASSLRRLCLVLLGSALLLGSLAAQTAGSGAIEAKGTIDLSDWRPGSYRLTITGAVAGASFTRAAMALPRPSTDSAENTISAYGASYPYSPEWVSVVAIG